MISLNKLSKITIGIIGVLVTLSIFFNVLVYHPIVEDLQVAGNTLDQLKSETANIDLPLRVVYNIMGQITIENDTFTISEKLQTAYDKNNDLLNNWLINYRLQLNGLYQRLGSSRLLWFSPNEKRVTRLLNLIQSVDVETSNIYEFSQQTLLEKTEGDFPNANEAYGLIVERINIIHKEFHILSNSVINTVSLILNIIFFGLVFLVLSLSFIILRLINRDMAHTTKAFEQIETYDYDKSHLPELRPFFREEKHALSLIDTILDEHKLSNEIKNIVIDTYDMDDLLIQLFSVLEDKLNIDRIGICFVDYSSGKFIAESGFSNYRKPLLGPGFSVDIESSSLKEVLIRKTGYYNNDLENYLIHHPNSTSLKLILKEGLLSNMTLPLLINDEVFGIMFLSSKKKNQFDENSLRIATKIIHEISGFLNRAYFIKVIFTKFTLSFSTLVNERDYETGDHLQRMTLYSGVIANHLREKDLNGYHISENEILEIERYAALHDIGKVAVPDNILKKPGMLNEKEWGVMKSHVLVGREIFQGLRKDLAIFNNNFFETAENIIAYHHEKWDGSGYPYGLKGFEIPLEARIIALGDVFDALTSARVYKEAFSMEKALEIIKESRGTHFDPVLVDIFFEQLDEVSRIYHKYQD